MSEVPMTLRTPSWTMWSLLARPCGVRLLGWSRLVDIVPLQGVRDQVSPHFMRGAHRVAMRLALEEIELGSAAEDERRTCRGMEVVRDSPKNAPAHACSWRYGAQRGDWEDLLIANLPYSEAAAKFRSRRRRSHQRQEGGPC